MSRSANNDDVDPYSYIGDEDLANRLRMMDALSEHMSSNSIEGQQPASDGGDDKPYDVWDVKKNWLFWLIYAIITLILVVPFWSLLALAYCDKIPKFFRRLRLGWSVKDECPLCESMVKLASWKDGSHRRECLADNRAYFEAYAVSCDGLPCPTCSNPMMALNLEGKRFECSPADVCGISGEIMCDGDNWYCCYPCDYSLCRLCAKSRLGQLVHPLQAQGAQQQVQQQVRRASQAANAVETAFTKLASMINK